MILSKHLENESSVLLGERKCFLQFFKYNVLYCHSFKGEVVPNFLSISDIWLITQKYLCLLNRKIVIS